jgi:CheY-like chemotaxis protein
LPVVRCMCGAAYTAEEWRTLARVGIVDFEHSHPAAEGEDPLAPLELRTCRKCGSTISTAALVEDHASVSTGPRALVVEDDDTFARAMTRLLTAAGFVVASSPSGDHALDRVRRGERFEFIVSDCYMPGLDGVGFHEAARGLWPEIDGVLVFVTGAPDEWRARLRAPWFAKPVGPDFHSRIRAVMEQWRKAAEATGPPR